MFAEQAPSAARPPLPISARIEIQALAAFGGTRMGTRLPLVEDLAVAIAAVAILVQCRPRIDPAILVAIFAWQRLERDNQRFTLCGIHCRRRAGDQIPR